ncbi:hypothetical protein CpB0775 [Chlamydia pneumoniae TW-183]|uniref:Uncharacterized protein n=2 Tax=Chlamydia pneumoniae TaxID=83558 RepID=A0A0F7XIG7_CHLPN|nr:MULTISPECIES: hypothetical protein [Chlamydia]CRI42869.1 Uncharacterized protein BN1224_DC9_BY_00110 [Chlamydia pneumoniae]AAP98704.1 hypothetical protein CpB0775 [Chlamydia pneumoniae TW-183]ACZ32636.1 conserved hypothetical protein [Chlamydia pneumoniae LPCoLN]ETR79493.1 hypothetical protein X556_1174 [Chlamydia pneumoniae B21]CRI51924.1 Uncharacterized protein BN1224_UZG1_B_00730 [Chlamydia pneumoniae]
MKDLIYNNLVRFKNISKTKEGIFVNFKVKGVKGGASFTASIAVDIDSADLSSEDSMEVIIEKCAQIGVAEFQKCEFQFEGITCL